MKIVFGYAYFLCSHRIRASGQPFIAYDPGMTRDALAYYGCAELFQVCSELGSIIWQTKV